MPADTYFDWDPESDPEIGKWLEQKRQEGWYPNPSRVQQPEAVAGTGKLRYWFTQP